MGLLFPTPLIIVRMKIVYVKCQIVPELNETQNQKTIRSSEEAPWLLPCDLFSF